MKKSLIAMIAALFCSALMAQVLVYDYAASFKRIDVTQKTKKLDRVTYKMDSPKVVSDKFTGYVVVNACTQCTGKMETSTDKVASYAPTAEEFENDAIVYITRKGDKAKNVYRAVGFFRANMFGANAIYMDGEWVASKFTDASAWLSFPFDWNQNAIVGFLGLDNTQNSVADLNNGGYGKVSVQKWTEYDAEDCVVRPVDYGCYMVKSISGSTLGYSNWTGHCSDILFDICLDFEEPVVDDEAPVPGTFTLKLNNKLSFKADFVAAEAAILDKAKWNDKVIYVPADDKAYTIYGLKEGKYWGAIAE